MSPKRSDKSGPEEQAELAREEQREARDEEFERVDEDAADQYDDDETLDEVLEIDQTELEELGLTLDDRTNPTGSNGAPQVSGRPRPSSIWNSP